LSTIQLLTILPFTMKSTISARQRFVYAGATPPDGAAAPAERDFTTLDGRIVPRALGEMALRQHTALLVGGLLIGEWPEQL
jgi:hypothetical protein